MRGLVDHFIKAHKEELDADGNQIISDSMVTGLIIDFTTGGMPVGLVVQH